jgi:hypothetical protein
VQVLTGVGEVSAVAAVDPATVDEQRLVAVVQRRPLDLSPIEVKLGRRAAIRSSSSRRSASGSFVVVLVTMIRVLIAPW